MILRAYYKEGALTGSIEIKHLVNSEPALYTLYISHDINGVLIKQEYPSVEKAMSKATTLGCISTKWTSKQVTLNNEAQ
jgi:hypothetical protein